ncbi:MAG TPA: efflux RND transporter periplasmic adaptor subunit [Blastocatellia bacterium]|nr:efflux RND transporter periplasmic adaptor subunit [Blastocatellia bacterium]
MELKLEDEYKDIPPEEQEHKPEPARPLGHIPVRPRKRSRWPYFLIAALLVAVIVTGSIILLHRPTSNTSKKTDDGKPAQPTDVVVVDDAQIQQLQVEPVTQQTIAVDKETTGKVSFNEDRLTPVVAPYSGRALEVLANKGDRVSAGQPLVVIESPDLVNAENQLTQARSDLAKADISLKAAEVEAERSSRLHDREAISTRDFQQAQNELAKAQDDQRRARAALSMAESLVALFGKTPEEITKIGTQVDKRLIIRAPITGTIVDRKIGPGQFVQNNAPDPLFLISDLSTLWIQADLFESDLSRVKVGAPVEITTSAFPDKVFPARISFISPTVDPSTRTVHVRCAISNKEGLLKPEMFARIKIGSAEQQTAIAVPSSAVVTHGTDSMVFVEQSKGHFQRRQVHIKGETNGLVEIRDGLQPGERVATRGSLLLNELGH